MGTVKYKLPGNVLCYVNEESLLEQETEDDEYSDSYEDSESDDDVIRF